MNKVYLLLRKNQQTGPHSLEELVQSGLQDSDLIWVEGKSACWSYPSEISPLKPYVTTVIKSESKREGSDQPIEIYNSAFKPDPELSSVTKPPAPKKIYVSLPSNHKATPSLAIEEETLTADSIEQKAEELRRRALAYKPAAEGPKSEETIQTKYSRTLKDVEDEYTSWIYSQKSKKKSSVSKKTLSIALVLVFIGAGYFMFRNNTNNQEKSREGISAGHNTGTNEIPAVSAPAENTKSTAIVQSGDVTGQQIKTPLNNKTPDVVSKKTLHKIPGKPVNIPVTTAKGPGVQNENAESERAAENQILAETKIRDNEKVLTQEPQKKKSLGDKLDGFFGKLKRKKPDEKPESESRATTPDPGTTERKARRRGDASTPGTETANLQELVDITSNSPKDNWMLGVQGLKLTLHNRSNETIKTAAIEVRYYNEQSQLLEKKVVNFNNVAPEKSVTVAAPDHRLADHTDFQVVSLDSQNH